MNKKEIKKIKLREDLIFVLRLCLNRTSTTKIYRKRNQEVFEEWIGGPV